MTINYLKTTVDNPYEVTDGEWFTISKDGDKPGLWGCCDCGLMHRVEFMVENGIVLIKIIRDQEATDAHRKSEFFLGK